MGWRASVLLTFGCVLSAVSARGEALSAVRAATAAEMPAEVACAEGTLPELVAELTSRDYLLRDPSDDPRPYADPTDALRHARRAASAIAIGDLDSARRAAERFGYQLVEFFDSERRQTYLLLREDLAATGECRGWGAYLFNPMATFNAVVEAPHPLGDSKTTPIAARVFAAGARGLLIAGAHRDKADLPDLVSSVFHQVHSAWIGPHAGTTSVQVHGFAAYKHDFPDDAAVILSTGGGQTPATLVSLDEAFDRADLPAYVYNRLPSASDANRRLNGSSPGERFRSLAATKNLQGRYARGLGGTFVHVELEWAVRHDASRSAAAADVVARTLAVQSPLPNPTVRPTLVNASTR